MSSVRALGFALVLLAAVGLEPRTASGQARADAGVAATLPTAAAQPRTSAVVASKGVPAGSAAPVDSAPLAGSATPAGSAAPVDSAAPVGSESPPAEEPLLDASFAPAPSASAPPAVASALPPPAPSAAHPEKVVPPGVSVRFGDEAIFALRVPHAGRSPEERASGATRALARAAEGAQGSDVRVERRGDVAVVLVGQTPIVQLVAADAEAAGDASLDVHVASVASAIREAVESERKRAAIARSVISFSLLVFLGLVAFYLVQKVGEFAQRLGAWIEANGERVLAVRVRRIEVVSPGTVKSTALVGLSAGKWIAQIGIVYTWLVVVLSLFDATRGYTQRLTGFIVQPLTELTGRIATGLPMLVVLVIAGFAVFVLVRFVGLFFSSVARRETVVAWIPHDLVAPVSVLVRFGIVVAALVFLAPLVTGSSEGALARSGLVVLVSLGLSATPVLASGIAGSVVLFSRRLRVGQHVELGSQRGRVSAIGLFELVLEDDDGTELRLPHLYMLGRPMRVLGLRPRHVIELALAPGTSPSSVREAISRVLANIDPDHLLELVSADADRTLYRLRFAADGPGARSELSAALHEALVAAKIPLGRLGSSGDA